MALREGAAPVRPVGDGVRLLIPHRVAGGEAWGSRAGSQGFYHSTVASPGPWLNGPGPALFWRGLYRRWWAYLGRLEPLPANGYQLVVGLHTANLEATRAQLAPVIQAAGWESFTAIAAPGALVARRCLEAPLPPVSRLMAAAVLGDTTLTVQLYRLNPAATGPRFQAVTPPLCATDCGAAAWSARVAALAAERLGYALPPAVELAVYDATWEWGAQLSSVPEGQLVPWQGPLAAAMLTPLQLSPASCSVWPEAQAVQTRLAELLSQALATAQVRTVDELLWGGLGATWPCGIEPVARQFCRQPPWRSATPPQDIAIGAALWPELVPLPEHPPVYRPPAELPPPRPPRPSAPALEEVPPWERDRDADEK